jgi:hypothetical protein
MRTNEKLGSKKWSIIKVKYRKEVGISKSKEGAGPSRQLYIIYKNKVQQYLQKKCYIYYMESLGLIPLFGRFNFVY